MFSNSGESVRSAARRCTILAALGVSLLCFLTYLRALHGGFINLDDWAYVSDNVAIRHLDGRLLAWAWGPPRIDLWMPLTWISFALDYRFWGLDPRGYHLTNILLHAVNSGLVVVIAARLCGERFMGEGKPKYFYPAFLVLAGLFFGVHPLRVESVAWVAERKDVLSGFFLLGAFLAYLRYAQAGPAREERGAPLIWYLLSLGLFTASLMAKPIGVVMPLLLLVADWYPLGRLKRGRAGRVLAEKVPFLVISLAVSLLTIYFAAWRGILVAPGGLSPGQRLVVSGNAVFEYCRLLLWPVGIDPLRVIPDPVPFSYTLKSAAVLLFSWYCIRVRTTRPVLLATWLVFLIPLVPVSAFVQNGIQALAARYTYLPSVGASIAAAAFVCRAYREATNRKWRPAATAIAGLVLVQAACYGALTRQLIDVWHDSGAYWTRVIGCQPFDMAYFNRALYYAGIGRLEQAAADYTRSIALAEAGGRPGIDNMYAYRGDALIRLGRYGEAVSDFTAALTFTPKPDYYYQRAVAYRALGNVGAAAEDYRRAALMMEQTGARRD